MLKRNPGTDVLVGMNHFTYVDARHAFYKALTFKNPYNDAPAADEEERRRSWGTTFQSLRHIIHHLQDMAQPQTTPSGGIA
jgi:hypothetical protein